ncbi:MAG: exo-alpha-sialidase [Pirellulales bacterium]
MLSANRQSGWGVSRVRWVGRVVRATARLGRTAALSAFLVCLLLLVWRPFDVSAAPPATSPVTPLSAELRERCLKILRAGLASDAFWPAMHAAEALSDAGFGREVRPLLWERLPQERDDQRRCGLAREIVRSGDRRAVPELLAVLQRPDPYGHTHAAESLYKIAESGDGRLLRQLWQQTPDARRRLMAAAALARCGNRAALQQIRGQIAAPEAEARKIAAWILARLGDEQDIEPLRRQRDGEPHPVTRAYQDLALAALGETSGREALTLHLAATDDEVRTYASEMVGVARRHELQATLVRNLDDPFLDVRLRAAQSLLALARTPGTRQGSFAVDVYPASPRHPRYSEGSVAVLDDGRLLYATTEFQDSGSDFARARIIARTSADQGNSWDEPSVLQENVGQKNVMSVSFVRPVPASREEHPLLMFYLQKDGFDNLHVFCRTSRDEGKEFAPPVRVTTAAGYHVMNNDRVVRLTSGRLLCPLASTADVQRVNHFVASCVMSDDQGRSWRHGQGTVDLPQRGAMEPEVLELADGHVLMIVRTQLGSIYAARSSDGGETWSAAESWGVAAPESPATLRRIPATGDLLLVWNNRVVAGAGHGGPRRPLVAAVSADEGRTWSAPVALENRDDQSYAYTSVAFFQDRVLLTYYVSDDRTQKISSRFRSLPITDLYPPAATASAPR